MLFFEALTDIFDLHSLFVLTPLYRSGFFLSNLSITHNSPDETADKQKAVSPRNSQRDCFCFHLSYQSSKSSKLVVNPFLNVNYRGLSRQFAADSGSAVAYEQYLYHSQISPSLDFCKLCRNVILSYFVPEFHRIILFSTPENMAYLPGTRILYAHKDTPGSNPRGIVAFTGCTT